MSTPFDLPEPAATGLHLYSSNRMEVLADCLAALLRTPATGPLQSEPIVIQSRGMERWLTLELARRLGICANLAFPFPRTLIYELFAGLVPDVPAPDQTPLRPEVMVFKILSLLPQCLRRSRFASLKHYLRDDLGGRKRYQLAERLARTFDQYLTYRPELIREWEAGRQRDWQAELWRLINDPRSLHPAAAAAALRNGLSDGVGTDLPPRVFVFGISSLPPFYIDVLAAAGQRLAVHLFVMSPCLEWWGDITSPREQRRLRRRSPQPDAELHLDSGNQLLASLGGSGRDFQQLLMPCSFLEYDLPVCEPQGDGALAVIQRDILRLTQPQHDQRHQWQAGDRSLQVHACHSPTREVEVLHDRLLELFAAAPDLQPRDVLIMTPDIEAYAPVIHAVFGAGAGARLPYTIADRRAVNNSRILKSFMAILDLAESRLGAAGVLDLLEAEPIHRRFDLDAADLDLVRHWVRQTRIRWGRDGEARRALGLPATDENTWRAGLDRLLCGYAMIGGERQLLTPAGILPYDEIEGPEAQVLGQFAQFLSVLLAAVEELGREQPPAAWAALLHRLLGQLFALDDDDEKESLQLRSAFDALGEHAQLGCFDGQLSLAVVRQWLLQRLESGGHGGGFIAGGVTFAAMVPMRSIPFAVIGLIGMNDNAYPRRDTPASFDKLTQQPRLGDRSRRIDDRYLFLETLMSARQTLYISYVGQSITDNSARPPSVLVSELLDYVDATFAGIAELVIRHPLQPFSQRYFGDDPELFSYSVENCGASRSLVTARADPEPFIDGDLVEPDAAMRTVSIDQLARFFRNPARYFLEQRLGIRLDAAEDALDEREPFIVEGLDQYWLRSDMIAARLGDDAQGANMYKLFKAAGRLPHGNAGLCAFRQITSDVSAFATALAPYRSSLPLPPLRLNLQLGEFRLTGVVDCVFAAGEADTQRRQLLNYRLASLRASDLLRYWIQHLAVSMTPGPAVISRCFDRDPGRHQVLHLQTQPEVELASLLALYWRGLCQPLPFFPETSQAFVKQLNRGPEAALEEARRCWEPQRFGRQPSESEDPAMNVCFRYLDPFAGDFAEVAAMVYTPLLRARQEQST